MMGMNRLERFISASVGVLSLGAFIGIALPVKAQTPTCYMITQTGQLVNLSSICGVQRTPINRQQANQNLARNSYGQGVVNRQFPLQQPINQGQNYVGQQANSFAPGFGRPSQGTNVLNSGVPSVTVTNSAEVRSEPNGGSLVQQLQGGEPVRVYQGTQTNNSVLVETSNGQRGWLNIWNLPGTAGASP